jgi:hypothetical protein
MPERTHARPRRRRGAMASDFLCDPGGRGPGDTLIRLPRRVPGWLSAGLAFAAGSLATAPLTVAAQQAPGVTGAGPEAAAPQPDPDGGTATPQQGPSASAPRAAPTLAQLVPGIEPIEVPRPAPNPQEQQGPIGVLERPRPELEPLGIQTRLGLLTPSANASAVYDSNIFATQANTTDDLVLHLHPEFKLDSGQGIFQYLATGYGELVHYTAHDTLSNLNGGATLSTSYAPTADFTLRSDTAAKYGHQDPASFAVSIPNTKVESLPPYSVLSQSFSGTQEFNRLGASLSAGYLREDYSNITIGGILFDQGVLDANAFSIGPKFSYALTPLTRVFLQAEYLRRDYDFPLRNSNTYTVTTGSDFEITRLTKGSVFAGYRVRQYDSASIGTVATPSYGINVSWYPSELVTVLASGKQDYSDTTVTGPSGAPAVLDIKTFKTEVDYEMRRALVLSVSGAYENDDFGTANRVDNTLSAGAVMTYTLNRNAALFGQYKYTNRLSSLSGFNYDRHQIGVGLRVQY